MSKKSKKTKQLETTKNAATPKEVIKKVKNPDGAFNYNVTLNPYDTFLLENIENRRLCLFGDIGDCDDDYSDSSGTSMMELIEHIFRYNREDRGLKPKDRKPIILYINSPGGDVVEGFALVSAIEASSTPIYTVNLGQWSSMAFLIGIAGKKRFALPHSIFLLHDGTTFAIGSSTKVQDKAEFNKRYEKEITRKHVLKYTKITRKVYEKNLRKEFYMLTADALELGVIDKIVRNLDEIL